MLFRSSRAPVFQPEEDEDLINQDVVRVAAFQVHEDISFAMLVEAAKADSDYQVLVEAVRCCENAKKLPSGHPGRPFAQNWLYLSVDESGLVMYNARVVVPKGMRQQVLESIHKQHMGIGKTKRLAKALYFWPGINNEISQMINSCSKCCENLPAMVREAPITTTASRPFEAVSMDLFEHAGDQYLVCVDRYSGWPMVAKLRKTDTKTVTKQLVDWMVDFGKFSSIRTDGGPQFRGQFDQFCNDEKIIHEKSSPHHPQSNGHAESAVKNMKRLVKTTKNFEEIGRAHV